MNRDLHDIDNTFQSAYSKFEAEPSPLVWEKINAALDEKDLGSHRSRFISWRRVVVLLALIPVAYVLFDTGIPNQDGLLNYANTINKHSSSENNQGKLEKNIQVETPDPDEPKSLIQNTQTMAFAQAKVSPNVLSMGKLENFDKNENNFEQANHERAFVNRDKTATDHILRLGDLNQEKIRVSRYFQNIQSNTYIKPPNKKQALSNSFNPYWLVSAFVSYDMLNYTLESDVPNYITSIKHREVPEPSFTAGILATRQFFRHWGLQSGVTLSFTSIGISPQKIYAFEDPSGNIAYKYITSSGYAYIKPGFGQSPVFGDSIIAPEAKHTSNSINIPVVAKYRIGNNKWAFVPGAGIEASFITSSELEVEISDAANREIVLINKLKGTKTLYWSAVVDAELQYKLNNKFSISLSPAFRYAISPITENNVVETFPRSFNIRASLTRKF